MNPIRWGVLGTAAIALQRTLPAMVGTTSARLGAIASRDLARAELAVASFHGARAHASYEALLADPDDRCGLHPAAQQPALGMVRPRPGGGQARPV
jgi:predicted dehydrogenase